MHVEARDYAVGTAAGLLALWAYAFLPAPWISAIVARLMPIAVATAPVVISVLGVFTVAAALLGGVGEVQPLTGPVKGLSPLVNNGTAMIKILLMIMGGAALGVITVHEPLTVAGRFLVVGWLVFCLTGSAIGYRLLSETFAFIRKQQCI